MKYNSFSSCLAKKNQFETGEWICWKVQKVPEEIRIQTSSSVLQNEGQSIANFRKVVIQLVQTHLLTKFLGS